MRISPQSLEIERVYTYLVNAKVSSLAITSVNSGEGTTTLTSSLAERCLLAGRSTLVVDLNLHQPGFHRLLDYSTIDTGDSLLDGAHLIEGPQRNGSLLGITAPTDRSIIIKLREPGVLESCISNWKKHFDVVIFDTSPIKRANENNIPPERIAAACDGAILSVLSGQTSESMVIAASEALASAQANLLGSVLNDCHFPSLKTELAREVARLQHRFPGVAKHLLNWINGNRLLSLEL